MHRVWTARLATVAHDFSVKSMLSPLRGSCLPASNMTSSWQSRLYNTKSPSTTSASSSYTSWVDQRTRNLATTTSTRPPHIMSPDDLKQDDTFNQEVFHQSLALSRSRLNDSTEIQCMLFHSHDSFEPRHRYMTKAHLAEEYDLDGRDLRNIDLVSSSAGFPHLLVRPSTIFISLFSLRLLVKPNQVLLILLEPEDNHIRIQDVLLKDLRSRLEAKMGSGLSNNLPFELRVVDAALAAVIATLEAENVLIRRDVEQSLYASRMDDSVHSALRRLRHHGKRLVNTEQRARQVRSALQQVLANDEDMAMMYLSDRLAGRAHLSADHQEVEYLLEAYYKNADAIAESANALIGDVNRAIDTIQSVLDIRRNEIMMFEAQLEIWMLGFAASTFVAGLFGMNVINYFEESAPAFAILVSGCMLSTLLIGRYGIRKLRKFRRPQL